jgi:LpxI C-terminal domain
MKVFENFVVYHSPKVRQAREWASLGTPLNFKGVQALQTMQEAGARVLALESGMTILLDEPEVLAMAERLGIAIVSLKAEELQLRVAG